MICARRLAQGVIHYINILTSNSYVVNSSLLLLTVDRVDADCGDKQNHVEYTILHHSLISQKTGTNKLAPDNQLKVIQTAKFDFRIKLKCAAPCVNPTDELDSSD